MNLYYIVMDDNEVITVNLKSAKEAVKFANEERPKKWSTIYTEEEFKMVYGDNK